MTAEVVRAIRERAQRKQEAARHVPRSPDLHAGGCLQGPQGRDTGRAVGDTFEIVLPELADSVEKGGCCDAEISVIQSV